MPSTQDLQHGIDFTGINPATGADHNTLIDHAFPGPDVGLIVVSADTALDTPDVPDALTFTKWKKYIWVRIPFPGAADATPIPYAWNDNVVSAPSFVKWLPVKVDITSLINQINQNTASVEYAVNTSQVALGLANSAITAVGGLGTELGNISTEANNASQTATQASKDVASLNSNVTALTTKVDSLTGQVGTKVAPDTILTPGTGSQILRTKLDASGVEWINLSFYISIVVEQNAGNAGGSNNASHVRALNTILSDEGGNISGVNAGAIAINHAGKYLVRGCATSFHTVKSQLNIGVNGASTVSGLAMNDLGGFGKTLQVSGVVTLNVGDTISLIQQVSGVSDTTDCLGSSAGFGTNVFAILELMRIG